MTLSLFSPLIWALGLLGLAGILYALQRLRVRHRVQPVVTTLFWKEALEEAQARVLVRRFRHFLAFLFVLLIVALLWLGVAGPHRDGSGERTYLVLVDASASAQVGRRQAQIRDALIEASDALPSDRTTVIRVGATAEALLAPGEPWEVALKRFDQPVVGQGPAAFDETLRHSLADSKSNTPSGSSASDSPTTGSPTTVVLIGDARVSDAIAAQLPAGHRMIRWSLPDLISENHGVVTLGVSPASSGLWDRVDVRVEIDGYPAPPSWDSVRVTLNDAELPEDSKQSANASPDLETRWIAQFSDLPANGGKFSVELPADGFTADDRATIALPRRAIQGVAIADPLRAMFGDLVNADPAFRTTLESPDVAIATAAGSATSVPTLLFVPASTQEPAILIEHLPDEDSESVLSDALATLGLDQIDAVDLADQLSTPITVGARPATVRRVLVWEELLAPELNFTQSHAFPLFVAYSLRWLADAEPITRAVAAGEPWIEARTPVEDGQARSFDPVDARYRPRAIGEYREANGRLQWVSLQSEEETRRVTRRSSGVSAISEERPDDAPETVAWWLALAALALLSVEWVLFRTGRMP